MSGFGNYKISWRSDCIHHIPQIIKMTLVHYGTEDIPCEVTFSHYKITNLDNGGQKLEFKTCAICGKNDWTKFEHPFNIKELFEFIKDWLKEAKYPQIVKDVDFYVHSRLTSLNGYWIKFDSYNGLSIETDLQIYPL